MGVKEIIKRNFVEFLVTASRNEYDRTGLCAFCENDAMPLSFFGTPVPLRLCGDCARVVTEMVENNEDNVNSHMIAYIIGLDEGRAEHNIQ